MTDKGKTVFEYVIGYEGDQTEYRIFSMSPVPKEKQIQIATDFFNKASRIPSRSKKSVTMFDDRPASIR